jgi:PAS domain-containing protein
MSFVWWLVAVLVAVCAAALFLVARRLHASRVSDARSSARLAAVLEGVSAGLSVWSPEQRLLACNARFREFYAAVELKPDLVFEDLIRYTATRGVVRLDEDEIESWVTGRLSRFGEAWVEVLQTAEGGWLEMRCVVTEPGEVVMLYADVTATRDAARRRERDAERRGHVSAEKRLTEAVDAMVRDAASFEAALGGALELACGYTGWAAGHALQCEPADPASLVSTGVWYPAPDGEHTPLRAHLARMPPGQYGGAAARAVRSRETVWVANMSVDPSIDPDIRALLTGIRGICAVPVVSAGKVVAVLEFLAHEQLAPDPSLNRALQEVATALSESHDRRGEPPAVSGPSQ